MYNVITKVAFFGSLPSFFINRHLFEPLLPCTPKRLTYPYFRQKFPRQIEIKKVLIIMKPYYLINDHERID